MADTKPSRYSIPVHGQTRKYIAIHPEGDACGLFFFLHGSTQSGNVARRFTDETFDRFAAKGFIVIYPDGVARHWNDGRATLPEKTRALGTDDVRFISSIIDQHQVDGGQLYFAGYSNGGQMVLRLLHELGRKIDGAAVIAATQPRADNFLSDPAAYAATPLLFMHGTLDKLVPFDGGQAGSSAEKSRGQVMGFKESLEYYAGKNGCNFAGQKLLTRNNTQVISQIDYGGSSPVRGIAMEGVGHVVPTHNTVDSPHIGPATSLIVAAEVIDGFFSNKE